MNDTAKPPFVMPSGSLATASSTMGASLPQEKTDPWSILKSVAKELIEGGPDSEYAKFHPGHSIPTIDDLANQIAIHYLRVDLKKAMAMRMRGASTSSTLASTARFTNEVEQLPVVISPKMDDLIIERLNKGGLPIEGPLSTPPIFFEGKLETLYRSFLETYPEYQTKHYDESERKQIFVENTVRVLDLIDTALHPQGMATLGPRDQAYAKAALTQLSSIACEAENRQILDNHISDFPDSPTQYSFNKTASGIDFLTVSGVANHPIIRRAMMFSTAADFKNFEFALETAGYRLQRSGYRDWHTKTAFGQDYRAIQQLAEIQSVISTHQPLTGQSITIAAAALEKALTLPLKDDTTSAIERTVRCLREQFPLLTEHDLQASNDQLIISAHAIETMQPFLTKFSEASKSPAASVPRLKRVMDYERLREQTQTHYPEVSAVFSAALDHIVMDKAQTDTINSSSYDHMIDLQETLKASIADLSDSMNEKQMKGLFNAIVKDANAGRFKDAQSAIDQAPRASASTRAPGNTITQPAVAPKEKSPTEQLMESIPQIAATLNLLERIDSSRAVNTGDVRQPSNGTMILKCESGAEADALSKLLSGLQKGGKVWREDGKSNVKPCAVVIDLAAQESIKAKFAAVSDAVELAKMDAESGVPLGSNSYLADAKAAFEALQLPETTLTAIRDIASKGSSIAK